MPFHDFVEHGFFKMYCLNFEQMTNQIVRIMLKKKRLRGENVVSWVSIVRGIRLKGGWSGLVVRWEAFLLLTWAFL